MLLHHENTSVKVFWSISENFRGKSVDSNRNKFASMPHRINVCLRHSCGHDLWPLTFDLWPLTLKTFSAMMNTCAEFYQNPSTKYCDITSGEIAVNGRTTNGRMDDSIMICLRRLLLAESYKLFCLVTFRWLSTMPHTRRNAAEQWKCTIIQNWFNYLYW